MGNSFLNGFHLHTVDAFCQVFQQVFEIDFFFEEIIKLFKLGKRCYRHQFFYLVSLHFGFDAFLNSLMMLACISFSKFFVSPHFEQLDLFSCATTWYKIVVTELFPILHQNIPLDVSFPLGFFKDFCLEQELFVTDTIGFEKQFLIHHERLHFRRYLSSAAVLYTVV